MIPLFFLFILNTKKQVPASSPLTYLTQKSKQIPTSCNCLAREERRERFGVTAWHWICVRAESRRHKPRKEFLSLSVIETKWSKHFSFSLSSPESKTRPVSTENKKLKKLKIKTSKKFEQKLFLSSPSTVVNFHFNFYEQSGIFKVKSLFFIILAFSKTCPNIKHLLTSLQFLFFLPFEHFLCTFSTSTRSNQIINLTLRMQEKSEINTSSSVVWSFVIPAPTPNYWLMSWR